MIVLQVYGTSSLSTPVAFPCLPSCPPSPTGWHEFAEFTTEDVGTVDSGLNSMVCRCG